MCILSHHRWQQPSEFNSLPHGQKTEEKVLWAVLSCVKLGGSTWKLTAKITWKTPQNWKPLCSQTPRMVLTTFFMLPSYFYPPLPALFNNLHLKAAAIKEKKKRTDLKKMQPVFKGIFKSWHCACLLWTMPWQMQELWFLNYLNVFLKMYYTEKNYFTYSSISVALADVTLTIYQIWKMSLNIEIYFKHQNCSKTQSMSTIRNNTLPKHAPPHVLFSLHSFTFSLPFCQHQKIIIYNATKPYLKHTFCKYSIILISSYTAYGQLTFF